jgi:hypothetical protein
MPAVRTSRFLTPARTGIAALAVAAVTAGTALALVAPASPALGAADALAVPAAAAIPVTYADTGSPALDKAQRAAATGLATAKADALAVHQAHLSHTTHLAVLTRLAAQKKAAAAAARQLLIEQAAAKKAHSVAPVAHHQPAGSSGGSSSSGSSGCSDPSGHLTASQMSMLWLCAGGPSWAVSHALRIAMCESGWNTFAHNPSGATGLWQILGQVTAFGGSLRDAHVNALNAVAKFRASGDTFAQWVCQ